jgi:hypothetical protein
MAGLFIKELIARAAAACTVSQACTAGVVIVGVTSADIYSAFNPTIEDQPAMVPLDTGHVPEADGPEQPPLTAPASPSAAPPPPPVP